MQIEKSLLGKNGLKFYPIPKNAVSLIFRHFRYLSVLSVLKVLPREYLFRYCVLYFGNSSQAVISEKECHPSQV